MKLNQREKIFILIGGILLAGMLAFLAGKKFIESVDTIEEESSSVEETLNKIRNAGMEYRVLQNYRAGGNNSTLENMVPFLENLINNRNLRERLGGMTPRDTDVEKQYTKRSVFLTFREISGQEILELVKEIENNTTALYQIENFSTRPLAKKPGIFNVSLTVAAFQKKSGNQ